MSRLDPGRPRIALIVAPHPDDEVIGAAHLIRVLMRRGARVVVVVVSDGAASHPGSRLWPRRRLVRARRRESLRALARLGVTAGAVHFLGLPDGALPLASTGALQRIVRRLAPVGLLVGPAADDAHPDHRWVADALGRAGGIGRRLAYRVWPPRRRAAGRAVRLKGAGGHVVKRSLIGGYRTQTGAIRDDPAGFAIARHELATFANPIELFTEVRR